MGYARDTYNEFGSDLDRVTHDQILRSEDVINRQKGGMDDYLNRFRGAIGRQEQLGDMYKRIGNELGLPQAQQAVNTLTSTVANLPGELTRSARGADVNQGQLTRQIAEKVAPVQGALTAASAELAGTRDALGQQIGFEQSQQAKDLAPYQTEQQMLSEYYAREMTGYNQAAERELNGYIQKLNAGITLTEGEKTRANQLAMAEMDYKKAIETANISANASRYSTDKQFESNRQDRLLQLAGKF